MTVIEYQSSMGRLLFLTRSNRRRQERRAGSIADAVFAA